MRIFPEISFTQSESMIIAEALTLPAVVKYLHSVAYNIGADICEGEISEGELAESYLRKQSYVKGGLGVINMLLEIEPATLPITK